MDDISIPPAGEILRDMFRNAVEIDIEVGYFTFAGWREIYSVIPENTPIRVIIGMLPDKDKDNNKVDFGESTSVAKVIAQKAYLNRMSPDRNRDSRMALEDIASRLCKGSMQVRGHWKIHGKMYASKKRFSKLRIVVGTGNISKMVLDPKDENYQGNIWVEVRRAKTRRAQHNRFEKDWDECQDASDQLLQLILNKLNLPSDWQPPKVSFIKKLFRKREV